MIYTDRSDLVLRVKLAALVVEQAYPGNRKRSGESSIVRFECVYLEIDPRMIALRRDLYEIEGKRTTIRLKDR